jgi:hypothetical protein
MAPRSVRRSKPPKPKAPILTAEQKRRRIERLKKCIRDLQAFDPQRVQKRFGVPEVFALEAAIDKALSSAFGHGTSAYMRYNRAAALDHGPLITNVPVRSTVLPPASGRRRICNPEMKVAVRPPRHRGGAAKAEVRASGMPIGQRHVLEVSCMSVQRVEGRAASAGGSIRCGPGSRSISSVIGGSSSSVLGTALHPAPSSATAFFLFFLRTTSAPPRCRLSISGIDVDGVSSSA